MKPIPDALRRKIDALRKTPDAGATPSWVLELYRDREKMLGIIDAARITSGASIDTNPTVAQASDGHYEVLFERAGQIYGMQSSQTNDPEITWNAPAALFAGYNPDIDYGGSFSTTGEFTSGDLLCVYENPTGTLLFRRRSGSTWAAPVTIGPGSSASIVRAWADPPEVGTNDDGIVVFYIRSGQLCYRQSLDRGQSWSSEIALDLPTGGTKRSPHVFRVADYTLGVVYEYDNGITSDIYMLKTTRHYVNIASPDETVQVGAGAFRQFEFVVVNISAPDETVQVGAGAFRHGEFQSVPVASPDETVQVGAGAFRQVEYTGVNP
ncbi:MAG: hypothetical protein K6T51_01260 [Rubrobacteraceae bacterium]|nr:hypothetical protein [Rubrobacteraceae bacterium]